MENNTVDDELERNDIMASNEDPMEAITKIRLEEQKNNQESEEEEPKKEVVETSEEKEEEEPNIEGEEELDEQEEEPSQQSEEEEEKSNTELHKFRANGQDFEFTQEEINEQFGTVFGKAIDYTQKMQKISPYRKMISALEQENISQDQLNLAIDALKGDKGAIQKIVAENKIDIYDIDNEDEDNAYTGNDYGKSPSEIALEEVQQQIYKDPEYPQTLDVISNQWDGDSRVALADNPEWISGLHSDIKSGVFAKVSPEAAKLKVLDGGNKPDIEYYLLAGQQLLENSQNQPVEDLVEKNNKQFKSDSAVANKKRSASSTRSRSSNKSVIDYLDDDDDEKFNEWYNNIIKNS